MTHNIVIFAAGVGSRLDIGRPKFLFDIDGKRLFEYQLSELSAIDCVVYVVCGFQSHQVCQEVTQFASKAAKGFPQICFVYNPDFKQSQVVSIQRALGCISLERPTLFIDGDMLFKAETIQKFIDAPSTTVLVRNEITDDAVVGDVQGGRLNRFQRNGIGDCEWANVAKYTPFHLKMLTRVADERQSTHHFDLVNSLTAAGETVNVIRDEVAEIDTDEDIGSIVKFARKLKSL